MNYIHKFTIFSAHFYVTDEKDYYNNRTLGSYQYVHLEVEDDNISVTSNEFVKSK